MQAQRSNVVGGDALSAAVAMLPDNDSNASHRAVTEGTGAIDVLTFHSVGIRLGGVWTHTARTASAALDGVIDEDADAEMSSDGEHRISLAELLAPAPVPVAAPLPATLADLHTAVKVMDASVQAAVARLVKHGATVQSA